jgi:hypothetical protein
MTVKEKGKNSILPKPLEERRLKARAISQSFSSLCSYLFHTFTKSAVN